MKTQKINLLVYDTPENFAITKKFIGEELTTYKRVINVTSKEEVYDALIKIEDKTELVFLAIHVFSETLDGVRSFKISGINDEFSNLKFKYITNQGKIDEMCKDAIDKNLPLCKKDVYTYHGIKDYLNEEKTWVPTVNEILSYSKKTWCLKREFF